MFSAPIKGNKHNCFYTNVLCKVAEEIWKDEYLKWVCGFANANGGKIFIGKNDKGEIIGIENSKKLLEDLPNKIQNHLGILCDVILHQKKWKTVH